jgi:hypothetical protein
MQNGYSQLVNCLTRSSWLPITSINALNDLADEDIHFGYPEFDEDFIKELKKEIPEAIKYATKAFDWIRFKAPRHIASAF